MKAIAELIADRGEAAASEEFFRSPPFLEAEGATHTLVVRGEREELRAPLIVREVPGGGHLDATSPYGYPGFAPVAERLDPAAIDFSATRLVSAFIRHTLGPPPLAAATERSTVQIADPAQPLRLRGSDRNRINKNRRRGYEVRLVPGPRAGAAERAGFLAAYEQTMRRAGAAQRYYFGPAYFETVLRSPRTWLALASVDGEIAAGSIAAASDGYLHYYLSGTADAQLRDSPMKNVVAALIEHAAELGMPLNLGGGIVAGDRLEEFKRGFANRTLAWHTSELICDPTAYERLSPADKPTAFFPAYRSQG